MKKKLFGNNIETSCSYCEHSKINGSMQICTLNRVLKDGKCRKFKYNPVMRVPLSQQAIPKFSKDDFKI